MKNLKLYILSLLMVSLTAVSCVDLSEDMDASVHDGAIVLNFSTPDVAVKGTVADNACESYMSHLDIVIYEYKDSRHEPFHHERVSVSATPEGSVSLHKTKKDFEENTPYKFFVIANSNLDADAYYKNGSLLEYADFLNLDQTDKLIHLSGVDHDIMNPHYPQMFLMDGVAYMGENEPASPGYVVVNDPDDDDEVELNVILRRAAAKIILTIIPGDKVKFNPELMAKSQGYLVRNMPNRTKLVAEGGYPLNDGGARPYWESTTISQSPYFQMVKVTDKNGVEHDGIKLTAYCYSHKWDKEYVFERGTSVVMMLPLLYKESDEENAVEYINNYYQLSITKNQQIKRNTLYDLRITLNAPGAEDITTPEEVDDIQYFTAPWETIDLPVTGESTVKYLKVNKEKIYMYNISDDNSSLYFSSSSPVSVKLVSKSAHYYNKFNQKITLEDRNVNITASATVPGSVSGNISVHSDVPTNHTILYFQLQITNEDGMSEIVDVEQYPLIYITNNLPWYSYRDDYYYRTHGGHGWDGYVTSATASGDLPTTYRYAGDHIVSVHTIKNVNVDTKKVEYTYTSQSSNHNSRTGWTASKYRGEKVRNSENYSIMYYSFSYTRSGRNYVWTMNTNTKCEDHNVRNYHVRMMASSKDYTVGRPALDENGYTSGDADNAKLVSPSFVIASRLGAVLSTYSGLSNMSNDKKLIAFADHCKNYVEVDDVNDDKADPVVVYDNWRLPTEAELRIIMDIQGTSGQNADAIDFLLNGGYYMSASGPVFNHKNNDGTTELADPMQATGVAIRCVRDAF
ncbi:MAG: hypothetical protein J6Q63_00050 [Bacteroidales bacterium]|nr:hypothetical protein [Bacteroidales bacterium]